MKKISKKLCAGLVAALLLASVIPTVSFAAYGTASLETKLDNDIVVYENHFENKATDFDAVYNKDVDYGIHNTCLNAEGGVKYTDKADFKDAAQKNGHSSDAQAIADNYFGSYQIRAYNGNNAKQSKGFWIDLDKVLEDYGPGTYTFSFRTSMFTGHGLAEACLNTLEDQSQLGDILWGTHTDGQDSDYVNIGGHVLCRKWDESGDVLSKTFTSTTYIPEGSEHLRFFFGGSIFSSDSYTVGGSTYKAIFFDDLVITKKANGYNDPALQNGTINLSSTITPLGNVDSVTGTLASAIYSESTHAMLDMDISDPMTITTPTTVTSSLEHPGSGVDYQIKSFFFDSFANLSPFCLSYDPHESLMPNPSFEAPFTSSYRWMSGNSNLPVNTTNVYTGSRSIQGSVSNSGTWLKVGQGAIATANGTVASPTSLAQMLLENGKGTYKVSFMAKMRDNNANVKLEVRRYVQSSNAQDKDMGTAEVTPHQYSATQTLGTDWQKMEFEIDLRPKTLWGSAGVISYRKNNYQFSVVVTSTNSADVIYIDDFKVEKISD